MRISSANSGRMRSSASRMSTHSFFQVTFSSAQFFFLGNWPFQRKSTTRAPSDLAFSHVPSREPESTTATSSLHATDARQSPILLISLRTGMRTEIMERQKSEDRNQTSEAGVGQRVPPVRAARNKEGGYGRSQLGEGETRIHLPTSIFHLQSCSARQTPEVSTRF